MLFVMPCLLRWQRRQQIERVVHQRVQGHHAFHAQCLVQRQLRCLPVALCFPALDAGPGPGVATRERCECFDTQGQKMSVDVAACVVNMQPSSYVLAGGTFPEPVPPPPPPSPPQFVPHYNDGLTFADIRQAMRQP